MKNLVLIAILVAAAACGGKKSDGASSDCAMAIGKGVDAMMAARAAERPDAPADAADRRKEMAGKLKGAYAKRCAEDKWPAEVVACFGAINDRKGIKACESKLTPEQQQKVTAEAMQVMLGARGGNGMPPGHPPDLAPTPPPAVGSAVAPPAAPVGAGSAQ